MATETTTTTQGAPAAGTPSTAPVQTSKNSPVGKVILGVIVVLIAFGIYKSATGSRAPETPEGVMARMMQNMKGVTSAEFAGTVEGNIEGQKNPLASLESFTSPSETETGDESKPMVFTLGLSGFADMTNVEKPKSNIKLTLSTPDFPTGQSAELEFRTLEENKYFKLNKVPTLGTLNLAALAGNWVNLDTKALKEQFGSATSTENTTSTDTLSEDKKTRIKNIITSAQLFDITEDKGDSEVGGIAVYHYMVTLNEAEVMRVAREIHEIREGKSLTIDEEKKMTEFWATTEIQNGEVWIGKKDYYLYGVSFNMKMEKTEDGKVSKGEVAADLQLRNFNKPVTVETPANALTIQDFMGQVIGIVMMQSFGSGMLPQ